jgi:hypothetical protein
VDSFPVIGRYHFNCIPGAAIEKRAVWSFANALLTANAEIWIDFDASERRMIFVGYPEHAGFDGTVFDARRGSGATGAAVSRDRKYSGPFLACRLAVAF